MNSTKVLASSSVGARMMSQLGQRRSQSHQRGYVMVVSVVILLLITLMSVSMAKRFFLEEGMASNIREKNRSLMAAQTALAFGEFVAMQNFSNGSNCGAAQLQQLQVCSNQQAVPANGTFPNVQPSPDGISTMPLTSYYQLTAADLQNQMNKSATGGTDKFFQYPGVYIMFLGTILGGNKLYQITAFGYGGSQNSVTVLQSTFRAKPSAILKG